MKAAALVALVLALSCGPPASEAGRAGWVRSGLELYWRADRADPPPPPVDRERMAAQIATGCVDGAIRYGSAAAMRGVLPTMRWPEDARRLASAAALADDFDAAVALLSKARALVDGDPLAQAVLANLRIETALQFGRTAAARGIAARLGSGDGLPGPLVSDRLFWRAVMEADGAGRLAWRDSIAPTLDKALRADPSSFQVRVWRVIAFLKSRPWRDGRPCNALIGTFSDLVLDTTQGSVCPLMLGHLDHALARAMRRRPAGRPAAPGESWQLFASGLIGVMVGHGPMVQAASAGLSGNPSAGRCTPAMARALAGVAALSK